MKNKLVSRTIVIILILSYLVSWISTYDYFTSRPMWIMWLSLSLLLSMIAIAVFIISSVYDKLEEISPKQKSEVPVKQTHVQALDELIDYSESKLLSIHRTLDAFYLDKDYVEDAVKNLTLFLKSIKEKSEELKEKEY